MLKINTLRKSHHILWNFLSKTTLYCVNQNISFFEKYKSQNEKNQFFFAV